jgi:transglutaminase-like putative cysteine protease
MPVLVVQHVTSYRYARPVAFGDHRLMFRPRDSHDLRLLDTRLVIDPAPAGVRWLHDVFGNSIAIASFDVMASSMRFESDIVLEHFGASSPDFPLEAYARTYPFSYSAEEVPDLGRTMERHYPDPDHEVDAWAKQFVVATGTPPDTRALLAAMTAALKADFSYQVRDAVGTQPPVETLALRSGSCRDYALLMMEAARSLGFAARFVSGYLYDPALDGGADGTSGAGATHAWVQIYLPGAGWVEFDPTNGVIGGSNLIRVAVARDPNQAVPLSGEWYGSAADFLGMTVDVRVTAP